MTILIHIGYHKTASTWFQKELFGPGSEQFVPLCERGNPRRLGRKLVIGDDGYLLPPYSLHAKSFPEALRRAREHVADSGRTPVISEERLSGNPHASGFDGHRISERLAHHFPEARILCVVREQNDATLSHYRQYIRIGGTASLEGYLTAAYDGRRPGFSPHHLRYMDLVQQYHRVFGPESLLVLPYEMFRERPEQFVERLGEFLGRPLHAAALKTGRHYNRRRKDRLLLRCPALNALQKPTAVDGPSPIYFPGSSMLLKLALAVGNGILPDVDASLRKRVEAFVGDRYDQSNKELSRLIGIDLSQWGYH